MNIFFLFFCSEFLSNLNFVISDFRENFELFRFSHFVVLDDVRHVFLLVIRNTLRLVVRVRKRHWLVVLSQHFCQIMLQRGQCCADSRRSKSVSYRAELRERLLNTLIKNWSRFRVADWRAVLRQKILQLFHDVFGREAHVLSRVDNFRIVVLPTDVFSQLFCRKFCLADVAKVSCEMNCFSFDQRRQKRDICSFSSSSWKRKTDFIESLSKSFSAVFGFGASKNTAKKRSIETFWRRKTTLDFGESDFVFRS